MEVGEISGTDGNPTRSVSLAARRAESLARDSDMLERALGSAAPLPELQRGDLLFWEGHVAIARDATMLVHGNAFHMAGAELPEGGGVVLLRVDLRGREQ